jgi:hypothetical protein
VNRSYITAHVQPSRPRGARPEWRFEWHGDSPYVTIPDQILRLAVAEPRGGILAGLPWRLRIVGEQEFFMGPGLICVRDEPLWLLHAFRWHAARWLRMVGYRLLWTLILWGLAPQPEMGGLPSWRDVFRGRR